MLGICLVLAQLKNSKVTLHIPGARLVEVIKQISPGTEPKLTCGGHLQDVVVSVDVIDVPEAELTARIAGLVDGKWVATKEGLELVADPVAEKARLDRMHHERGEAFRKAVAKIATSLADTPVFDAAAAQKLDRDLTNSAVSEINATFTRRREQRESMYGRAPAARALVRILTKMDPEILPNLRRDRLAYFAVDPNSFEFPLQVDHRDLALLQQEQATWSAALGTEPPPTSAEISGADPRYSARRSAPISRLILRVNSTASEALVPVTLVALDKQGEVVCQTSLQIDMGFDASQNAFQLLESTAKNGDFELPPSVLEYQRAIDLDYDQIPVLTKASREKLLDPARNEPLANGPAVCLTEAARRVHRNFLAVLEDNKLSLPHAAVVTGKVDPVAFLKTHASSPDQEMTDADGWITIRPHNPLDPQMDRVAFGTYLRATEQHGYAAIDDLAILCRNQTSVSDLLLYEQAALWPHSERLTDFGHVALRIWGLMSEEQRGALRSGEPILLSSLPGAVQRAIADGILYSTDDFSFQLQLNDQRLDADWNLPRSHIPPEVFWSGLPMQGKITCQPTSAKSVLAAKAVEEGDPSWCQVFKPGQIASVVSDPDQPMKKNGHFWLGNVYRLAFTIDLGGGYTCHFQLRENQFDLRSSGMSFESLPNEIQRGGNPARR